METAIYIAIIIVNIFVGILFGYLKSEDEKKPLQLFLAILMALLFTASMAWYMFVLN